MVLAEIVTDSSESAWYRFFHERRFVNVRYLHGPMGVQIRTQREAAQAAADALMAEPHTRELIVR
jgi:hypothetical protein